MKHKTSRMGRPPKPKAEKLSRFIAVRVSPGEFRRLSVEARRLGLSLSGLLMRPHRQTEGRD